MNLIYNTDLFFSDQEFEDHVSKVSKDYGSGREKPKKTPWGTPHSETRTTTGGMKSGGQSSLSGARAQAYSSDSPAMNRSSTWSKAPNKSSFEGKTVTNRPSYGTAEKRSTLSVTASRSAAGAATGRSNLGFVAKRPIPSLTARRSALGFAASRYATATKRPTFSLAAKRSAVGGPAAASRLATARRPATPGTGGVKQPKSIYALPSENKSRYESTFGTGNKRGAQSVANEFGSNKRQKTSRFDNNVPTSKPASRGDSEVTASLSFKFVVMLLNCNYVAIINDKESTESQSWIGSVSDNWSHSDLVLWRICGYMLSGWVCTKIHVPIWAVPLMHASHMIIVYTITLNVAWP